MRVWRVGKAAPSLPSGDTNATPGFDLNVPSHEFCDADHTRRGAWRGAFRAMGIIHGFENSWGPWALLDQDQPGLDYLLLVRRFFTEIVPFAALQLPQTRSTPIQRRLA